MQVVSIFSDEGRSGKNTIGRLQFQKMMCRIQNRNEDRVDYVLMFKLFRFGRNAADVLNNLQIMQDFCVNLICVEDGIDSASAVGNPLSGSRACLQTSYRGQLIEAVRHTKAVKTSASLS